MGDISSRPPLSNCTSNTRVIDLRTKLGDIGPCSSPLALEVDHQVGFSVLTAGTNHTRLRSLFPIIRPIEILFFDSSIVKWVETDINHELGAVEMWRAVSQVKVWDSFVKLNATFLYTAKWARDTKDGPTGLPEATRS
jgi:hypothetical protein